MNYEIEKKLIVLQYVNNVYGKFYTNILLNMFLGLSSLVTHIANIFIMFNSYLLTKWNFSKAPLHVCNILICGINRIFQCINPTFRNC